LAGNVVNTAGNVASGIAHTGAKFVGNVADTAVSSEESNFAELIIYLGGNIESDN